MDKDAAKHIHTKDTLKAGGTHRATFSLEGDAIQLIKLIQANVKYFKFLARKGKFKKYVRSFPGVDYEGYVADTAEQIQLQIIRGFDDQKQGMDVDVDDETLGLTPRLLASTPLQKTSKAIRPSNNSLDSYTSKVSFSPA